MKFFRNAIVAAAMFAAACAPALAQFVDQRVFAGTSGGTSSAYTITIPNMPSTVPTGIPLRWIPHIANPSSGTLTVSGGSAAAALCKPSPAGPTPLTGGELQPTQNVTVENNGTCYLITSAVDDTSAAVFVQPQGYLTPCQMSSGSPVSGCTAGQLLPTGDVSAATSLFLEPAFGNQMPIWNGTRFVVFQFTEAQGTLVLGSSNLANTVYDVCMFSNAGTPTIGTSVAWTTSTPGSGARGSGAGTAQIALVGGIWTNAVQATVKNGASTYTVAANQCTIVATLLVDGTNGQASFTTGYGQNRKWSVHNFYNQQKLRLKGGDGSSSYAINNTTYNPSHNDTNNKATMVLGLPQMVDVRNNQNLSGNNATGNTRTGIGYNSTTVPSGYLAFASPTPEVLHSEYQAAPFIGAAVFTPLEKVTSGTSTLLATETDQIMSVWWKG